ncbi:hypothetical protein H5410_019624, partial [Solanum commersonii]
CGKKIWNCMLQWLGHRRQIQDWETEVNWMSQIARRRGGVAEITSCVFAMVVERKSRSVANGFMSENGVPANHLSTQDTRDNGSDRWFEKLMRRRQKSEIDFTHAPEMLLKEDDSIPLK